MKHRILDSSFGIVLYFLLRTDWVWALLSPDEREVIKAANVEHNTGRDGYADPETYGGGRGFDSLDDRAQSTGGRLLRDFLERTNPKRVVEFGPGSGYHTRQIVEHPSVESYHGVDINPAFLDFLRPRLVETARKKKDFAFELQHADFREGLDVKADAAILLATVHHIPDRRELFDAIQSCLVDGGHIFASDPTHYLPRLRRLLYKMGQSGYLKVEYRSKRSNLSTHGFCTLGEYRKICRQAPGLAVEEYTFFRQDKLAHKFFGFCRRILGIDNKWLRERSAIARWFSAEMAIILKKDLRPERSRS